LGAVDNNSGLQEERWPDDPGALFDLFLPVQEAIHAPDGAKILAFVQRGRIDLLGA
jgi:hypothetical protein